MPRAAPRDRTLPCGLTMVCYRREQGTMQDRPSFAPAAVRNNLAIRGLKSFVSRVPDCTHQLLSHQAGRASVGPEDEGVKLLTASAHQPVT
jgi:hypothetical protein